MSSIKSRATAANSATGYIMNFDRLRCRGISKGRFESLTLGSGFTASRCESRRQSFVQFPSGTHATNSSDPPHGHKMTFIPAFHPICLGWQARSARASLSQMPLRVLCTGAAAMGMFVPWPGKPIATNGLKDSSMVLDSCSEGRMRLVNMKVS